MKKVIIAALMMLMLTGCGINKNKVKEIEVPADVYKASSEEVVKNDIVQKEKLLSLMNKKNMHCIVGVHRGRIKVVFPPYR